ncbi:hypothetical protein CTI12_AA437460 [Artemisia annua]|uniref:WHEP-TRS domain-containing protein n=1 Tax=Artemisia annua TaxID=35608 RepID=A0A2U1LZ38_ARTAN|nr:hypothetical protein CTI12_AA437460 [Artemisia annua]
MVNFHEDLCLLTSGKQQLSHKMMMLKKVIRSLIFKKNTLILPQHNKLTTINHHGDVIRNLKSSHVPKSEIDDAVKALNALKLEKTEIENELKPALNSESNGNMSKDTFRQAVVNTLEYASHRLIG